jgi:hypothetical protein
MLDRGAAYLGLDPFSGDWSFFSEIGLIAEMGAQSAMTDEMGLVYDYFFLRMDVHHENIVQPALDMPDKRLKRYLRHRAKLLYTPFNKVDARQIWGVENALELFVLQEIVSRGTLPRVPQAMIFLTDLGNRRYIMLGKRSEMMPLLTLFLRWTSSFPIKN